MKGKGFLLAAAVLVAVIFSSCYIGDKGDVYVGYGWDNILTYFSDNNPTIANLATVTQNAYYHSWPGTYYVEYNINYHNTIVFNYWLTPDEGFLFSPSDAYFYIYLQEGAPVIYSPLYRSLSGSKDVKGIESASVAVSKPITQAQIDALGEPAGVIEKSSNGYTMHLKYWKVE